MTAVITFYHNPRSRAQMAHWMLEEAGADYEIRHVDFEKGDNRTPEFLAINPMGKLPTIVHEGVVVTECAAIIAYIADLFPYSGLAPAPGTPARGSYYRWLFFGAGCIDPAVLDKMFDRPLPEQKGAVGYGSYEDMLGAIERALKPGPYLLGAQFSAADVYIASQLNWAGLFGAPGIKESAAIQNYVRLCTSRPAFQKTQQA